ncbi:unnamed protein product [Linum trigynum]|uniref:Reverse transcriptase domain-containing protein n=1 Tax=Linum trigynum TaxID=586398 RepID=A0AAV2EP37_9ROSI
MDAQVTALPLPLKVTAEMNANLTANVLPDEVQRTVFSVGSKQDPGSDGFTGKFFKAFWDSVGGSVVEVVCSFFRTSRILRSFNHTWLTLIPKVDNVESVRQLFPISLCQFVYKIITKIMTERLAQILSNVISEGQNAFIRERQIVDNVLLGYELMHYLKYKNRGKKGYMALKVEWPFLFAVLSKLGFSHTWIGWVQECLRSSSFSIFMNGTPHGFFQPTRGLR